MAKDVYDLGDIPPVGEVPPRMHAQLVRPERYGEPEDAIRDEVIDVPSIGPDEALVMVMAAGVNFNNVWAARGVPVDVTKTQARWGEPTDFHIVGSDAAGVVYAVGERVTSVRVGERVVVHAGQWDLEDPWVAEGKDPGLAPSFRVWGYDTCWGSFAQFTKVQAHQCLPKTEALTWEEAAAPTLTGATAYRMLHGWPPNTVKQGDVVLVWGASGGLGSLAVQLVGVAGARAVAVVSSAEKGAFAEEQGAVGFIDRTAFDHWGTPPAWDAPEWKTWFEGAKAFGKAVWDVVGERRSPNLVFEHPGQDTIPTSIFVCERGGMVVICAGTTGYDTMVDVRYLWYLQKRYQGSHLFNDEQATAFNDETSTLFIEYGYDKNGNVTSFRDARGHITTYLHDHRDRQTDVYLPNPDTEDFGETGGGPHTVTTYRDDGSVDYTIDPMGRTTTNGYDDAGRQTNVTFTSADEMESISTSTEYDDGDRVISTTDARGCATTYDYDHLDRQTDVYLPDPDTGDAGDGPHTITTYNLAGEVESVTDPLSHVTSYLYDGLGRQKKVTPPDPDGNGGTVDTPIVEYTYDDNGNLETQTVYDGSTPLVTHYHYDKLNRLTQVVQANGDTTNYDYDENNNRTSVVDDVGNTTLFEFDTRNRLHTETDQLENVRTYLYDENGNRIQATDGSNRVRVFDYDNLNRPIDELWLDDLEDVIYTSSMTYNDDGTLATIADVDGPVGFGSPLSSYAYDYDKLGRLKTVDNDGTPGPWGTWNVVLTSGYDENGNRTSLAASVTNGLNAAIPDFINSYVYDKINRQTRVQQTDQPGGNSINDQRADFAYFADGRMHVISRYSDLAGMSLVAASTYGYDDAGRLTSLAHNLPGTTHDIAYTWAYDRANRLAGYTRSDGGTQTEEQAYDYDDAGQLTGSTGDLPPEAYTYDGNGNRTNDDYDTPEGSDNQLASDGTYSYTYDHEGNLIMRAEIGTDNVRLFQWDYRNRLTAVLDYTDYVNEEDPGTLIQWSLYRYDALNRRISKTVDLDGWGSGTAVTTWFVYDGDQVAMQFNQDRSTGQTFLYGPAVDQVLANYRENGDILWALTDHLGSVRDIIDNSGSPLDTVAYTAFGEAIGGAVDLLFGYTGAVFDVETGLGYHRARYLDHATGRWLSEDPIGIGVPGNLYHYVGNGPTNATDPSGEVRRVLYEPLGLGSTALQFSARWLFQLQQQYDYEVVVIQTVVVKARIRVGTSVTPADLTYHEIVGIVGAGSTFIAPVNAAGNSIPGASIDTFGATGMRMPPERCIGASIIVEGTTRAYRLTPGIKAFLFGANSTFIDNRSLSVGGVPWTSGGFPSSTGPLNLAPMPGERASKQKASVFWNPGTGNTGSLDPPLGDVD